MVLFVFFFSTYSIPILCPRVCVKDTSLWLKAELPFVIGYSFWNRSSSGESFIRFAWITVLTFYISDLQNKIILDPLTFSEARFRPSLEERLESIISGAALMADSSCTRDDRRERIVAECNAVRQALQDLLSEYMNNVSFSLIALFSQLNCNCVH